MPDVPVHGAGPLATLAGWLTVEPETVHVQHASVLSATVCLLVVPSNFGMAPPIDRESRTDHLS
jgi:hypothetical protein